MESKELVKILDIEEKYRKYLYAKGYMITTAKNIELSSYPFYGLWRKENIGEYNFYLHPRQNLFTFVKNEIIFFLIGHVYNPITMQEDETYILEEVAEAYSKSQYFIKISELTGVFLTGYIHENEIYFVGDASCMQTSFYGKANDEFYISSHSQLLGDICGLQVDKYVEKLIQYRFYHLFGIMLPGDLSPYKEIKQLIPNHQVVYQDGKISHQRFWPTEKLETCADEKSYKLNMKRAAEILHNNMELISRKWRDGQAAISMTGGCDSKTTLSCANGLYDKFSYFSYSSSESEEVDVKAAGKICAQLNLKHEVYKIPDVDSAYEDIDVWRKILEQNTGNIGKQNKNDVRKRIYFAQHHDFEVEVKSWVSEVGRAYYNKRFNKKSFPSKVKARYLTAMYKVFLFRRGLVHETDKKFKEFLKEYYSDGSFEKVNWTDLIFWELRMRGWGGLVISNEQQLSFDITVPYNNRVFLQLLLSTPLEKRMQDMCHKDIQNLMNKQIANMNIAVTNLKHTDKRAKMERLYFEVQSRIPF